MGQAFLRQFWVKQHNQSVLYNPTFVDDVQCNTTNQSSTIQLLVMFSTALKVAIYRSFHKRFEKKENCPVSLSRQEAGPVPARTRRDPTRRHGRGLGAGVTGTRRSASRPTWPSPRNRSRGSQAWAKRSAARGLGAGETGTRRTAGSPTQLSLAAALKARPARRAAGTAAIRSGPLPSSRRSLNRGNGGPADSWSSQPGRTTSRDSHHLDGSRPPRAAHST